MKLVAISRHIFIQTFRVHSSKLTSSCSCIRFLPTTSTRACNCNWSNLSIIKTSYHTTPLAWSSSSSNRGTSVREDEAGLSEALEDEQVEDVASSAVRETNNLNLKPISCKKLLETGQVGQLVRVQGWIRTLRKFKKSYFFDLDDGSTFHRVPIVLDTKFKPDKLTLLSSVDVVGELVQNPKKPHILEIHPTQMPNVLGICDQQKYPIPGRWEAKYEAEHIRQYYHLRFKTNKFASLLRIRNQTIRAIQDYFHENEYVQIHTPIITANDCEGAGETFTVRPANNALIQEMAPKPGTNPDLAFFDEQVYLSVSSQLHLEAVTGGLDKVWTLSPIFRSENHISTRHLSEFYMLEAEVGFLHQIEQLLEIIEDLVKFCIRRIVFDNSAEFDYYIKENTEQKVLLEAMLKHSFAVMTFDEAREILRTKSNSLVPDGKGLSREQELLLVELNNQVPVFVINWPAGIKPFYMRQCTDSSKVSAVDLLVPRVGELCGGSLRENNLGLLESKLNLLDPSGKLKQSLEWYLDLRRFGSVPTGGFGLGFDRLMQFMLGCNNIKDVVPFPRWPHNCPM